MEYNNPPHPFSISPHLHLPCMMQVQSVQQEISVIRQRAHLPAIIAWYLRHSLCLLVGTAGFIRRGVNDSNRNKNDLWPQCWWPLSRITPHLLFLILLVSVIKWNNNIIYYNRSNNRSVFGWGTVQWSEEIAGFIQVEMDVEESVTGGDNMAVQHCPLNMSTLLFQIRTNGGKKHRMNLPFKKIQEKRPRYGIENTSYGVMNPNLKWREVQQSCL